MYVFSVEMIMIGGAVQNLHIFVNGEI